MECSALKLNTAKLSATFQRYIYIFIFCACLLAPYCAQRGFFPITTIPFVIFRWQQYGFSFKRKNSRWIWTATSDKTDGPKQAALRSIFPWYLLGIPFFLCVLGKLKASLGTTCSLSKVCQEPSQNQPQRGGKDYLIIIPSLTRLSFRLPPPRWEGLLF